MKWEENSKHWGLRRKREKEVSDEFLESNAWLHNQAKETDFIGKALVAHMVGQDYEDNCNTVWQCCNQSKLRLAASEGGCKMNCFCLQKTLQMALF